MNTATSLYQNQPVISHNPKIIIGNKASSTGEIITDTSLVGSGLTAQETINTHQNQVCAHSIIDTLHSLMRSVRVSQYWNIKKFTESSPSELLLAMLNDPAIQFNSRKKFSNDSTIQEKISTTTTTKKLEITIPAFCIIGNHLKRYNVTSVTFGEQVSLQFLNTIAQEITERTGVTITFNIVSDALFYVKPLMSCGVIGQAYLTDLRAYAAENNLRHISLFDMNQLIAPYYEEYYDKYVHWKNVLKQNPLFGLNSRQYNNWLANMAATLTSNDIISTPQERHDFFTLGLTNSNFAHIITERAQECLLEYRSMKNALSDICWDDRIFPHAIRASIHHKPGAIHGLRIYPEYKKSSKFLPYHGIAIVEQTSDKITVMRVLPEMEAQTLSHLTRVYDDSGKTQLYISNDLL